MVSATMTVETPNLVPVPPDWLAKKAASGPNTNRNINDVYWKKGPRESDPGWIVVGPSAQPGGDGRPITRQAERWIRMGRTPLVDYSFTDRISPLTGLRETIEIAADRLASPDRWYWILRNGGAFLFPIEQIVAYHWHITPPFGMSKDAFPQFSEWEVPDAVYCGACGTGAPRNSEEELISHLLIGHRMTLPQARDLIASYDIHEIPRGSRGLTLRRKAETIEKKVLEMEAEADKPKATRLIICDSCGDQFDDGLAKARHMKQHNAEARVAASQPDDANPGQVEGDSIDA